MYRPLSQSRSISLKLRLIDETQQLDQVKLSLTPEIDKSKMKIMTKSVEVVTLISFKTNIN